MRYLARTIFGAALATVATVETAAAQRRCPPYCGYVPPIPLPLPHGGPREFPPTIELEPPTLAPLPGPPPNVQLDPEPPPVLLPPRREYWGALAVGERGRYGYSSNHPSAQAAEQDALGFCSGSCRIAARFAAGQCVAIAVGDDGAYGWAVDNTASRARNRAYRHCDEEGWSCEIRVSTCNSQ